MAKASKEKIIEVTEDMLTHLPMAEVTVREIAKAASVNIAAIHYYFSTKEILYNAAIERIISRNIDGWLAGHPRDDHSGMNYLVNLVMFLHEGCIKYPEFARTRIWNSLGNDQTNGTNQKVFMTILEAAKKLKLEKDTERLKLKVSLLYASLASISASTADLNAFTGMTLNNDRSLRSYVESIVEILFNERR